MTNDFIDFRELVRNYDESHHKKMANAYFATVTPTHPVMRKPFASTAEAIELATGVGVILDAIKPFPGAKILDFGCGGGWLSDILATVGAEAYGVDIAESAISVATQVFSSDKRNHSGETHFSAFDGNTLPFDDETFDAIVCFDAFHHVANPDRILAEFFRVLRSGGIVAFHEPGPNHSKSAQSQLEMRNYGVIESDINVAEIEKIASSIGFLPPKLAITLPHPYWTELREFSFLTGQGAGLGQLFRSFFSVFMLRRRLQQNFSNLRIFSLSKPGVLTSIIDSRAGRDLRWSYKVNSLTLERSDLHFEIEILNTGGATWLRSGHDVGSVNLGIKSYDKDFKEIKDVRLLPFPEPVHSGATNLIKNAVRLPEGTEKVIFDLVSEHICWFEMHSNPTLSIEIEKLQKI